MPRVSVVIPVYDVESYLPECLDSVLSQSLRDIEIICVDDGSTDGSGAILAGYAAQDARVRIVTQENRGPSAARNAGSALAQGEYLYFLDADDHLDDPGALEDLYGRAREDELDVLHFDVVPFFEDARLEEAHESYKGYYRRAGDYRGVRTGPELLAAMVRNREYLPAVWLQLIRADYYRSAGLAFYEGILHEDNLFTFECALQARRVAYVARPYVRRRIRANSIMTSEKSSANFRGLFIAYRKMMDLVHDREFDDVTCAAVAALIAEVNQQALKVYRVMSAEEQGAIVLIDPGNPQSRVSCALLAREAKKQMRLERVQGKLEAQSARLAAVRDSRSHRVARSLRRLWPWGS